MNFNPLLHKHNVNEDSKDAKKVVNLSSHILETVKLSVLRKGLKFVVTLRSILIDSTIYNIKDDI
jgi:predicted DNA binding CopG/RHH family protein